MKTDENPSVVAGTLRQLARWRSMPSIDATFATRRDAEMTVERLVQQHGLKREHIVVAPVSAANSAGVEVAGADAKRGDPAPPSDAEDAALAGRISVSVPTGTAGAAEIRAVFEEFNAADIREG